MKESFLFFIVNNGAISEEHLKEVEKKIGNATADHLYLIIDSPGGDPFSAVAIMNVLDSHFKNISAIIPAEAKSAATLMALGTDEIYMCEKSSLGPLDLPIEHPNDGSRISSLDVQNTITTMASLADSIASDRYDFMRKRGGISKKDALRLSLETSNDFLRPIVEKVDPYHLQKAYRELKIGFWYAIDLLSKRMMKGHFDKAYATAKTLVNNFPAHEYSIFKNDAENMLNLVVKDLRGLSVWKNFIEAKYSKLNKKYTIEFGEIELPKKNDKK